MAFVLDDIIDRFWKDGRTKELEELADQDGFQYVRRERLDVQTYRIKDFRIFRGRKPKRLRGILRKKVGTTDVRIYDYVYYAEAKKRKTTVFELRDRTIDLPQFVIRPKRSIQWVKDIFRKNISFYPEAKAFHAYYEIDTYQRDLTESLTPPFIDLVASCIRLSVEGEGPYLLMYYRNKIVKAKDINLQLELALDLVECLKERQVRGGLV